MAEQQLSTNTCEIKIPAGTNRVRISATVSSPQQQRVTIKPDGNLPYLYIWAGSGEGTTIGSTDEDRRAGRVFTSTLECSNDGGQTWKPVRSVKKSEVQTPSNPPITIVSLRAESDGDDDFDDIGVHFIY